MGADPHYVRPGGDGELRGAADPLDMANRQSHPRRTSLAEKATRRRSGGAGPKTAAAAAARSGGGAGRRALSRERVASARGGGGGGGGTRAEQRALQKPARVPLAGAPQGAAAERGSSTRRSAERVRDGGGPPSSSSSAAAAEHDPSYDPLDMANQRRPPRGAQRRRSARHTPAKSGDGRQQRKPPAAAAETAASSGSIGIGATLARCADPVWAVRAEAFGELREHWGLEGDGAGAHTLEMLRHFAAVAEELLEHSNDAHHRVAQAALSALATYVQNFPDEMGAFLERCLPRVFLKISDPKEATRNAAVSVLEAMRSVYDAEQLLPVLLKTLEHTNTKIRLSCIDFLHYLMAHCGAEVAPFLAPPPRMKHVIGKLSPLVVDKVCREFGRVRCPVARG
jgi:hypothetical protein